LRSWRRQADQPHEIVVSDDSSEQIIPKVEQLALEYKCRYEAGPRRGLYANRNHAATRCTGTHIVSADDDHEHPDDYLARILDAVEREPRTVWCVGEFHSWSDYEMGVGFYPPGQLNPHGTILPASEGGNVDCWAIADGATIYPREIFDQGMRMYEGVRFGASYCEFGCLLRRLHWRIRPLAKAAVIHHSSERPRSFEDSVEHTSSEIFAALMFSFYYQPSLSNKLVSLSKIPIHALRRPRAAVEMIGRALRHFRIRRIELERLSEALADAARPRPDHDISVAQTPA
jgi:glycosyltransferase involved in cell wall biosynthesis